MEASRRVEKANSVTTTASSASTSMTASRANPRSSLMARLTRMGTVSVCCVARAPAPVTRVISTARGSASSFVDVPRVLPGLRLRPGSGSGWRCVCASTRMGSQPVQHDWLGRTCWRSASPAVVGGEADRA